MTIRRSRGDGFVLDAVLVAVAVVLLLANPLSTALVDSAAFARHLDLTLSYHGSQILLIAAGIVSLRRPEQRSNGRLMLSIVVVQDAASLAGEWGRIGPLAFVSDVLGPVSPVLFGLLLLRWPKAHLQTRAQRVAIGLGWSIPGLQLVSDLFYDPAAHQWSTPTWWPTLISNAAVADGLYAFLSGLLLVLVLVFCVLVVGRLQRASRPERRELIPVGIAAVLGALTSLNTAGVQLGLWRPLGLDAVENLTIGVIPLAFLIAVGVRRTQRALAIEELVGRGQDADPARVLQSLRRAMGDPRLDLATYSHELGAYVQADGRPAPALDPGRAALFVPATDGSPLARFDVDPRLADRPELTGSVARAALVALETTRLRAELAIRARDEAAARDRLAEVTSEGVRLSRLLPTGLPQKLRADPEALGRIDRAEVTVLMSDVRGYSTIAERTAPERLAVQLQQHRAAMNAAILAEGGTIMQYVGDAVMAVFGAPFPQPDHAGRALRAAASMHRAQATVNEEWSATSLEPFELGIGVSTGPVATALLGSEDRYEYTIVGDTVNLAQRLESIARPGGTTVASDGTLAAAPTLAKGFEPLPPLTVKGRAGTVVAYRTSATSGAAGAPPANAAAVAL